MKTCEIVYGEPNEDSELCGEPAVALVVSGCRHEHLATDHLCAQCLEDMNASIVWCEDCEPFEGDTCKVKPLEVKAWVASVPTA